MSLRRRPWALKPALGGLGGLGALATLAAAPLALAAGSPASALAADSPASALAVARLQGFFTAAGVVTTAVGVPGERKGDRVSRTWGFIPQCPAGACGTIQLVRQRGAGFDRILLHRRRPAYYTGSGTFLVAARCGNRIYRSGLRAKYTITLTVRSAVAEGSTVLATGFTATYRNPKRTGLTPCYSPPSYDSARYLGGPAPPAPAGSIRRERSTRSSTGS